MKKHPIQSSKRTIFPCQASRLHAHLPTGQGQASHLLTHNDEHTLITLGKQNERTDCPNDKLEYKVFFPSPDTGPFQVQPTQAVLFCDFPWEQLLGFCGIKYTLQVRIYLVKWVPSVKELHK